MLFLACLVLGAAGAWLMTLVPFSKRLLDTPNERSSHRVPTPRGGGIGIVAAFAAAGTMLCLPATFLFSAVSVAAVSFYGDYLSLSVKFRLIVQVFCAFIFLFPLMGNDPAAPMAGFSALSVAIIVFLAILFIVGTANLYNFMDGINGIAGLSGMVGFGLLGLYTLYFPSPDALVFSRTLSLLSIGISLACLGFLPFNMPKARVFMGDVGSILLGFVFAALVVTLSRNCLEMICFASLLFPFYADELTTMAVRLRDRENLTRSHRRHLYQLLVNELGIAHWKISLAYGIVQLTIGVAILAAYGHGLGVVLICLAVCGAGFLLVTGQIRRIVGLRQLPRR
jgi:Fuc2NAc and GlcNAc transferase